MFLAHYEKLESETIMCLFSGPKYETDVRERRIKLTNDPIVVILGWFQAHRSFTVKQAFLMF